MKKTEIKRIIDSMPEPFRTVIQMPRFSIDYKVPPGASDHKFFAEHGYESKMAADCTYYVPGLGGISLSSYGDWGTLYNDSKKNDSFELFLQMYELKIIELWRIRIYIHRNDSVISYDYSTECGWKMYNGERWVQAECPIKLVSSTE